MAIPLRYDAQLIAMVSSDLKDKLKAEATEREVSISQVAREYIEAGILAKENAWTRVGMLVPAPTEEQLRDADGPYFPTTEEEGATDLRSKARAALDRVDKTVEAYAFPVAPRYPDPETAQDAAEQIERNRLDAIDHGPTLSEIAAHLGVDPEAEDVEEVLGHDEHNDRLARLQARGLL